MPRLLVLLMSGLFLLGTPPHAHGETRSPFSYETGIEILYDDNLLRYADQDIQNPKVSDLIFEPYLLVQYKHFFGRRSTRIFADLSADFHADNAYKNYETYRFGIKQSLPGKTDLRVTYNLTPDYRITRTDGVRYDSLSTELRKAFTPRFTASLVGRMGWKDYTLDPYDTDLWEATLRGDYRFRRIKVGGGYGYEEGNATGDANTDPDYREQTFRAFTTLYPGKSQHLTVRFTRTDREFTTANPADTLRNGRSDTYRTYAFRYAIDLTRRVEGRLGYEHTVRETSGITPRNKALLDYNENLYQVGLSAFW
ncbi:MAG: hypothetical protein HY760_08640 [Nitrospirae bacterium]|nr:hypothetical protein [Nitrospirota bacterium]